MKDRVRKLGVLLVVLCVSAGFALAADLAGTSWQLQGVAKDKVKKAGKVKDSLGEVYLIFYEDNECVLRVYDDEGSGEPPRAPEAVDYEDFHCTWNSPAGKRKFTFQMDQRAAENLLASAWEDITDGDAHDGTVLKNAGKGKVSKDGSKIKLKLQLKATITGTMEGSSEEVTRKVSVKLKATGTEVHPK